MIYLMHINLISCFFKLDFIEIAMNAYMYVVYVSLKKADLEFLVSIYCI